VFLQALSISSVVVTSEKLAISKPLDEKRFEIFRLEPLMREVEGYVGKWFSLDT